MHDPRARSLQLQFTRLLVEIACWVERKKAAIYIYFRQKFIYIDLSFWLYICLLKIKRAILFISFVIFNCKIFFNASIEVSLKYFSGKIRSSFRALNALHRLHIFLQFLFDSSRLIAASGLQLNNTFTLQKRSVSLQIWVKRLHRTCNLCRGALALHSYIAAMKKAFFTLLSHLKPPPARFIK